MLCMTSTGYLVWRVLSSVGKRNLVPMGLLHVTLGGFVRGVCDNRFRRGCALGSECTPSRVSASNIVLVTMLLITSLAMSLKLDLLRPRGRPKYFFLAY